MTDESRLGSLGEWSSSGTYPVAKWVLQYDSYYVRTKRDNPSRCGDFIKSHVLMTSTESFGVVDSG